MVSLIFPDNKVKCKIQIRKDFNEIIKLGKRVGGIYEQNNVPKFINNLSDNKIFENAFRIFDDKGKKWWIDAVNNNHKLLIVSHHFRIREMLGDFKGLSFCAQSHDGFGKNGGFSIFKSVDTDCKIGFANCACIRLRPRDNSDILEFEVIFGGFPDKTSCIKTIENIECSIDAKNTNIAVEEIVGNPNLSDPSIEQFVGGAKEYRYLINNDKGVIDLSKSNNKILLELFRGNGHLKEIYLVRHGNAMHNKPINIKVTDSPLTELGVIQAEKLGTILAKNCVLGKNIDYNSDDGFTVMTSELMRAQHTTLCLLDTYFKKCFSNKDNSLCPDMQTNIKDALDFYNENRDDIEKSIEKRGEISEENLNQLKTEITKISKIDESGNNPMVRRSKHLPTGGKHTRKRVPGRKRKAHTRKRKAHTRKRGPGRKYKRTRKN